jgi:hypothetical protein
MKAINPSASSTGVSSPPKAAGWLDGGSTLAMAGMVLSVAVVLALGDYEQSYHGLIILATAPFFYAAWLLFKRQAYFSLSIFAVNLATLVYFVILILMGRDNLLFNANLRGSIFTDPLMSEALRAFFVFAGVLATLMLLISVPKDWNMRRAEGAELSFLKAYAVPAAVVGFVLMILTIRGPLITDFAYYSADYIAAAPGSHDQTLNILGQSFLMFSAIAAVYSYGIGDMRARAALLFLMFNFIFFFLLRGGRASFPGAVLTVALMLLIGQRGRSRMITLMAVAVIGGSGLFIVQIWPSVRGHAAGSGLISAVIDNADVFTSPGGDRGIMGVTRLPQMVWNVLDTVDLYNQGIQRRGQTYVNLIGQQVPKPVAAAVGYERPVSEPLILAQYRSHGGAIYPLAEAYWNFGLLGVAGVAAVIGVFFGLVENWFRRLPLAFAYIYFTGVLIGFASFGSGTQAFVRIMEVVVLLAIGTHFWWAFHQKIKRSEVKFPSAARRQGV